MPIRHRRLSAIFWLLALTAFVSYATYATVSAAADGQLWPRLAQHTPVKANLVVAPKAAPRAAVRSAAATVPAGNLNIARKGHAAIRLSDGKVLVVGGENANGLVRESEIYNPATHSFITAASLDTARTEHTVTRLADGRLLVSGGRGQAQPLRTTEIYDPNANVFTPGPALNRPRAGHSATVLADGRILIAGGSADGSAEIYNPAANSFAVVTGRLNAARALHSAVLLNDGKVLLAGGKLANGNALNSAEVFNPASQSFTAIARAMSAPRVSPVLNKLGNGLVQIIGGGEATMEIFNAAGGYFTAYSHLPNNAATRKTPGRAAFFYKKNRHNAAGESLTESASFASAVEQSTDTTDRDGFTVTETGGEAVIIGGEDSNGATLNTSVTEAGAIASITTDKSDYLPGEVAVITGTGFNAGQTVSLLLQRDPVAPGADAVTSWDAQADGNGNFTTTYNVIQTDFGVAFVLTATGQPDGNPVAQTTFTDGGSFSLVGADGQQHHVANTQADDWGSTNPNTSISKQITIQTSSTTTVNWSLAYSAPSSVPNGYTALPSANVATPNLATGTVIKNQNPPSTSTVTVNTTGLTPGAKYMGQFVVSEVGNSANTDNVFFQFTVAACTPPSVTTNPTNQTVTYGAASVSFSAAASGTATVTVQWQVSTDSGATWNNVSGATNTTLSIANPTVAQSGNRYRAVFSNSCGTATSTAATLTVNKATSITTVTCTSPVTYNGSAQTPCTASYSTSDGQSGTLTVSYSNNTNAGTASATATYAGDANHTGSSDSKTFTIAKADATCSISGYTGVYDATAHGATGSCTGVGSDSSAAGSSLSLGATFTNVPGGTANWTFTGGTNYNSQTGSVNIVISKADAVCSVNGYTGVYDAAAHGATGSCTGVGGAELSSGLSLGASFTNVPGGTASWSFAGGTNYNNQSSTAAIVISKADAVCSVSGYTGVYDAAAHGATGACTGVDAGGAAAGGSLNLGASFTNVPGGTANWSFAGGINYNNQSGSVDVTISKADAVCSVSGYTGVYDAAAHGATGACTGVGGVDLSSGLSLGASFTNVPGGTANWAFAGGINYNNQSGSVAIVISKADAVCSVSGYTGTYDAAAHGATGTCKGVGGVNLSGSLSLGASFTNVPGGTADWSFAGGTNYNDQSGSVNIVINKAGSTVTVTCSPTSVVYSGSASTPCTASATGVGLSPINVSASLSYSNNINVGTASASASWAGDTNHNGSAGSGGFTITKAPTTTTITCSNVTYNAQAQTPCTASVSGAGVVTGSATISYSNNTLAGTASATATYAGDANHTGSSASTTFTIAPRAALVNYIGQQLFVTSGTSATTAQVTLSASMQDPTGLALVGAKADFYDVSGASPRLLAGGVAISPVPGSPANTGTANTVVTLSTGQYGAESYLIRVVAAGSYTNNAQPEADKTAIVTVAKPAATNESTGGGTIAALSTSAGTYLTNKVAGYCIGMTYNKSGTNLQGNIKLTIPQANGDVVYIKSNSISSMAVSGSSSTIYTKASISKEVNGSMVTVDGNVTLRVDLFDGNPDKVGFTVLSTKDSTLYYSNNWQLDTSVTPNVWKTLLQAITTGFITVR